MVKLTAENIYLAYDSIAVVENMSFSIPEGKITVLIGANGCGKSTILRSLARLLRPTKGSVYLDGKEIHHQSSREVAKKLAILPQSPQAPEGLTVKELCYYGRHPHKGLFSRHSAQDHEIVEWALTATRMKELGKNEIATAMALESFTNKKLKEK